MESALVGPAVVQRFENGIMFWREDDRRISALLSTGYWIEVDDTWREGQADSDPGLVPPAGLLQPVRGFGKVWRELLRGPDAAISWAVEPERAYQAAWQQFERGTLISDDGGRIHLFRADRRSQP